MCSKNPDRISATMLCPGASERKVGQFALVGYIPDPLAHFLDDLRLSLTPQCNPHAHVTVLPPRPLTDDLKETIHRIALKCRESNAFEIELGDVEIFPESNVIFIGLRHGVKNLRELYRALNTGPLSFTESFPYHPHITIAQNLDGDRVEEAARIATNRWAEYRGPRSFRVESLSFVQQVATDMWVDLAELPLVQPDSESVSLGTR